MSKRFAEISDDYIAGLSNAKYSKNNFQTIMAAFSVPERITIAPETFICNTQKNPLILRIAKVKQNSNMNTTITPTIVGNENAGNFINNCTHVTSPNPKEHQSMQPTVNNCRKIINNYYFYNSI